MNKRLRLRGRLAISLLALCYGTSAFAKVDLAPEFGSGAVLQRNRPIVVHGKADPRERVAIRFGDTIRHGRADASGYWRVTLPSMAAGGPYRLTATGIATSAVADDVLIGDVWLCSGQSNMQMPIQRVLNWPNELNTAADPQLRLLMVPRGHAPSRLPTIGDARWRAADRDSVVEFSAACYFMVRELRRSQKVPIGAIDASYGGTRIRSWLPSSAATTLPGGVEDIALLAAYAKSPTAAGVRFVAKWEDWWRGAARQRPGEEPWRAPDQLTWLPVPRIGPWERWDVPALDPFAGLVWFRRTVALTPEQAAAGATLHLGVIEDMDIVWINGAAIGTGYGRSLQRSYSLPSSRLRAGENEIIVSVLNTAGSGGFVGPSSSVKATLGNGVTLPLADGWSYAIQPSDVGPPPRTPWESNAGLGTIYNAMVAPLGGLGLAGVAWYQGESDSSIPGYEARLKAMVQGWRDQFARSDLPFLIVSLAGFGAPSATPIESGRAQVREDQRRTAEGDPHSALVVAVDLGDRSDIHPANKQEVGRRLARAAKALAYGVDVTRSGPRAIEAVRTGGDVTVRFADVTGALEAWSGARPIGFELCGREEGSCRWAAPTIDGPSVRLADDGSPATRVRYAWGNTPLVNLYDGDKLPVGPFELTIVPTR